jgi:hypothetical protein
MKRSAPGVVGAPGASPNAASAQLGSTVATREVERRHGSALREAWVEEFDK